MQLVVADANVLFAGLIDPNGLYRKLLVVFAWAKLHTDLLSAQEYADEIEQLLAEHPGAVLDGAPQPEQVVADAEARIALLEEHLPAVTPTEFGLATSPPITKEVFDNAVSGRSGFGEVGPEKAQSAVAAAVAISSHHQIHGFDGDIPAYTEGRDVKDDPIIHTAILSRADWVLSRDKRHVALDWKRPTRYTDPNSGRTTGAIGPRYFTSRLLCDGLHFDQDDLTGIDGGLLDLVLRPLGSM